MEEEYKCATKSAEMSLQHNINQRPQMTDKAKGGLENWRERGLSDIPRRFGRSSCDAGGKITKGGAGFELEEK